MVAETYRLLRHSVVDHAKRAKRSDVGEIEAERKARGGDFRGGFGPPGRRHRTSFPAARRAAVIREPVPMAEPVSDGLLGPLLMLAGACAAALAWTATRAIAPLIGGPETVFLRTLILFVVTSPWLVFRGREMLLVFRTPLHLLRIFTVGVSVTCFAVALGFAPLVQVTALSFIAPFFVLILARLWHGERVLAAQWLAVATGFVGVLLVLSPGDTSPRSGHFVGALLAVVGAFCLAVGWTSVRQLLVMRQPLHLLLVPPLIMTLAVSGALAAPGFEVPPADAWPLLFIAAAFTILSHLLQMLAFRHGRPTRVAPVDFTRLIFASLFGTALLGETPSPFLLLGALLIAAAALYASRKRPPA